MAPRKVPHKKIVAKIVTGKKVPCSFCQRQVDDELTYGKLYAIGEIQCHYFCVLLSSCLIQRGKDTDGLFGFTYEDILREIERAKKHRCSFCGRGGANLGCSVSQCRKQFHLPCGRERNAVSLFFGNYKSFCQSHAPKQNIPAVIMSKAKLRKITDNKVKMKAANFRDLKELSNSGDDSSQSDTQSVCVICYEAVQGYPTINTFWPPCCARDAWFHRTCLQRMALSAGMHYLKCPLCNDKDNFYQAVVTQGYYVPDRDAAWELEQNAFAEIYDREVSCSADDCKCPMGRSHDADQGPWSITLCLLCGSSGSHMCCLSAAPALFVCSVCEPAAQTEQISRLARCIEAVISEEQRQTSSARRRGPVMSSRMSLRRTKRHTNSHNSPSCSSSMSTNTTEVIPEIPTNTSTSREVLNLRTPKKSIRNIENIVKSKSSPQKDLRSTLSKSSPQKDLRSTLSKSSPQKDLRSTLSKSSPQKDLRSTLSKSSPQKDLRSTLSKSSPQKDLRSLFDELRSPLELVEESLKHRMKEYVMDEELIQVLRNKFNKPKPLCEKKKIVNDILNGLFDNVLKDSKQKEPVKQWSSPKKTEISHEVIEILDDTPPSNSNKENTRTPTKIEKDKDPFTTPKRPSSDLRLKFKCDPQTFPVFNSPKKLKTVDILKDSSLEISAKDEIINIDVIKIENNENDEFLKKLELKTPEKSKKCAFKFSPYNKEVLDADNIDIDVESFKDQYLNEVGLQRVVKKSTEDSIPEKQSKKHRKRKLDEKIVLKYESKKRKKNRKNISIKDKNIKVKIKWRQTQFQLKISDSKKKKKCKKLKQYILECSPNNCSIKPQNDITPLKRKYIKQEKTPDNLVQTCIQKFFKVNTPSKD